MPAIDPFALPSETTGRFRILVVFALVATWGLVVQWIEIPNFMLNGNEIPADIQELITEMIQGGVVAISIEDQIRIESFRREQPAFSAFHRQLPRASLSLILSALLLAGAARAQGIVRLRRAARYPELRAVGEVGSPAAPLKPKRYLSWFADRARRLGGLLPWRFHPTNRARLNALGNPETLFMVRVELAVLSGLSLSLLISQRWTLPYHGPPRCSLSFLPHFLRDPPFLVGAVGVLHLHRDRRRWMRELDGTESESKLGFCRLAKEAIRDTDAKENLRPPQMNHLLRLVASWAPTTHQ